MTVWVFLIAFPLLMGAPVVVRVESETATQCEKVRTLLVGQLENHRSNATVSVCALGIATAVPPK